MTDFKMPDYKTLIACAAALYALLALLFPVRKKKQSAVSWIIAIGAQLATVWFFEDICGLAEEYLPMAAEYLGVTLPGGDQTIRIAAIALCVIVNVLIIIILNALAIVPGKRRFKKLEKQRQKLRSEEQAGLEQLQSDIAAAALKINSPGSPDRKR